MEETAVKGSFGYVPELDGFRAIPLIFVMWGHFGLQYSHFWFPVQGFFVLSGFLISRILIKEKEKGLSFKPYFKTYWRRRVLRIFPVYFLYLAILTVSYFVFKYPEGLMNIILSLFTYTFNFYMPYAFSQHNELEALYVTQHLWTMSVEEQFYLFLPLIVFFASRKQLRFWSVFFIVGSFVFRFFYGTHLLETLELPSSTGTMVRLNTFSHFDAFFMGVAINVFNLNRFKFNWWPWSLSCFLLLFGLGALNVISYQGKFDLSIFASNLGYHITYNSNYEYVWSYTLVNFGFLLCVLALLNQPNRKKTLWGSLLRYQPLVLFGRLSYGMYTYHILILYIFNQYINPNRRPEFYINLCWFALYVIIVFTVSWLSFEFFEKRFLKKKPEYAKAT